jgi:threonine synthase
VLKESRFTGAIYGIFDAKKRGYEQWNLRRFSMIISQEEGLSKGQLAWQESPP